MPSRKVAWDPDHWRFRAEEARTVADQMTHEAARTIMRRIAMDYDRLAKLDGDVAAPTLLLEPSQQPLRFPRAGDGGFWWWQRGS
jgi:hypothetical protein